MTSRPSRHQMRRHARQLRRDGLQPMTIVNSGDQLPATSAVLLGRAVWRYRSELAPLAIAAATILVASALHRAHPGAWPWLAAVTVAVSAALAVPPPRAARQA